MEEVLKEIANFGISKANQGIDKPIKVIKGKSDIFVDLLLSSFGKLVSKNTFP